MVDYTDTVCIALGLPRATHPLDGGTHTTRVTDGCSLDELIGVLREQNMQSVLEVEQYRGLSYETGDQVMKWKVRGLYGES